MKHKEKQKIADKFIQLETIIGTNEDPALIEKAKIRIMQLSSHLDPRDMIEIDELIQSKMQH